MDYSVYIMSVSILYSMQNLYVQWTEYMLTQKKVHFNVIIMKWMFCWWRFINVVWFIYLYVFFKAKACGKKLGLDVLACNILWRLPEEIFSNRLYSVEYWVCSDVPCLLTDSGWVC